MALLHFEWMTPPPVWHCLESACFQSTKVHSINLTSWVFVHVSKNAVQQNDQIVLNAGIFLVSKPRGVQLVLHIKYDHFWYYFLHDFVEIKKVSNRPKEFHGFWRILFWSRGDCFPFIVSRPVTSFKTRVNDISEGNTQIHCKLFDHFGRYVSQSIWFVGLLVDIF